MLNQSFILQTNPTYLPKLLTYHDIKYKLVIHGSNDFLAVDGFDDYNYLYNINSVFSTRPSGNLIDRTQTIKTPFKFCINRPWVTPAKTNLSLDDCFSDTVQKLEEYQSKINLFWSGGIDSSAMVIGFLKHSSNRSQLRILYTSASVKEYSVLFKHILTYPEIELINIGENQMYLDQNLDGIFVNGDGADDLTASLDETFFNEVGFQGLQSNWKNLFFQKFQDIEFIDFCQRYIDMAGVHLTSVLEFRWWFYTNSKIDKFPAKSSSILRDTQPLMIGFFNNYKFEEFFLFNINNIITKNDYRTYKYPLKKYIFDYTRDEDYYVNKIKFNSAQASKYSIKTEILKNRQYILLLGDGTRIRTDNLPFLSEREYRQKYQNTLDYLFNV